MRHGVKQVFGAAILFNLEKIRINFDSCMGHMGALRSDSLVIQFSVGSDSALLINSGSFSFVGAAAGTQLKGGKRRFY